MPGIPERVHHRMEPQALTAPSSVPRVLALDLEGTLISNAVSAFVRPGLFRFLTCCHVLFPRLVMFTAVKEPRFRDIANLLVAEGSVPGWFAHIEYVTWSGPTKNLAFVPKACVDDVLLLDDLAEYVHHGQRSQWVRIHGYEPPFGSDDRELDRVLDELVRRVRPHL